MNSVYQTISAAKVQRTGDICRNPFKRPYPFRREQVCVPLSWFVRRRMFHIVMATPGYGKNPLPGVMQRKPLQGNNKGAVHR